jgi:hypothetical protein
VDKTLANNQITFGGPGLYRIIVKGDIPARYSDRLGGMTVSSHDDSGDKRGTYLVGKMMDQSQLSGVLNALYELHLPILLVENLDTSDS